MATAKVEPKNSNPTQSSGVQTFGVKYPVRKMNAEMKQAIVKIPISLVIGFLKHFQKFFGKDFVLRSYYD